MRSVLLTVATPVTADAAYERLSDLTSYPAHSSAVRSVIVSPVDDEVSTSSWEVNFRNGVLRWTERDVHDRLHRRIAFEQLEGDVEVFRGSWHCEPDGPGCRITFSAEVDLGIPTLADALEPIAVRALTENTLSILTGLFGADVRVLPAPAGPTGVLPASDVPVARPAPPRVPDPAR